MPSFSCSLDIPSSSRCCSASLRMPSLSGNLGAGLTGKANGKCFCNRQMASSAGSCSLGVFCCEDFRLFCFVLSVFACSFSARRRSRSSASCSKPIVQFAVSWLIRGARLSHAAFWDSLISQAQRGSDCGIPLARRRANDPRIPTDDRQEPAKSNRWFSFPY